MMRRKKELVVKNVSGLETYKMSGLVRRTKEKRRWLFIKKFIGVERTTYFHAKSTFC